MQKKRGLGLGTAGMSVGPQQQQRGTWKTQGSYKALKYSFAASARAGQQHTSCLAWPARAQNCCRETQNASPVRALRLPRLSPGRGEHLLGSCKHQSQLQVTALPEATQHCIFIFRFLSSVKLFKAAPPGQSFCPCEVRDTGLAALPEPGWSRPGSGLRITGQGAARLSAAGAAAALQQAQPTPLQTPREHGHTAVTGLPPPVPI